MVVPRNLSRRRFGAFLCFLKRSPNPALRYQYTKQKMSLAVLLLARVDQAERLPTRSEGVLGSSRVRSFSTLEPYLIASSLIVLVDRRALAKDAKDVSECSQSLSAHLPKSMEKVNELVREASLKLLQVGEALGIRNLDPDPVSRRLMDPNCT